MSADVEADGPPRPPASPTGRYSAAAASLGSTGSSRTMTVASTDLAERQVMHACELLADLAPSAEGDGCRGLGAPRLAQGDLDASEATYRRAHERGWDP